MKILKKILLLDKDGTLIETKSGKPFINEDPGDQRIIIGADLVLQRARNEGWRIGVASNQLGIEKGYKTAETTRAEFDFLGQLFPEIEIAVWCPDYGASMHEVVYASPEEDSVANDHNCYDIAQLKEKHSFAYRGFRKPEPGMLQYLKQYFDYQKGDRVFYVGDRSEDQSAAANADVYFLNAKVFRGNFLELC